MNGVTNIAYGEEIKHIVLIGNIYNPPNKTEKIRVLNRLMENQRDMVTLMHEIPYGKNTTIKITK